jgi:hypothetical protein
VYTLPALPVCDWHHREKGRVAAAEPHALGVSPRRDAEAVVLYFVQPVGTARRRLGWGWQAGFNEAGYAAATL